MRRGARAERAQDRYADLLRRPQVPQARSVEGDLGDEVGESGLSCVASILGGCRHESRQYSLGGRHEFARRTIEKIASHGVGQSARREPLLHPAKRIRPRPLVLDNKVMQGGRLAEREGLGKVSRDLVRERVLRQRGRGGGS